ncbi:MAG: glucosamine-6-phosphate deaminase [Verrucomicrobiae bacterium]|nr:glucosamine-6-phosphate deaminase [Verrucomicrobiae bacterium]MCP5523042.1 glucosamine-6-phosphate deaminase [Verrucomicrobiales bacterium]
MSLRLERSETETGWVAAAAALWIERLRANRRLRMCLPAGLTPVRLYAAMIQAVKEGRVSFAEAEVFLLDEFGGLAPDDPGRCENMLRRFLLDHIDVPAERVHVPDVDAPDAATTCAEFQRRIGDGLDLVILGLGGNGHVGMNEPGTPPDAPTHRAALHAETVTASARYLAHDRFPTWGVTVGLGPLLAGREVWLLANGASKAKVVRRIREEPPGVESPASWFSRHPNCRLFLDAAAAGEDAGSVETASSG